MTPDQARLEEIARLEREAAQATLRLETLTAERTEAKKAAENAVRRLFDFIRQPELPFDSGEDEEGETPEKLPWQRKEG